MKHGCRPRFALGFGVLPMALALATGCESMSNTDRGVVGGGLFGAGIGALIGHATGHTGAGAAIGAGTGALVGGLAGHAEDKAERKAQIAQAQRQLGITDVVSLTQQHVNDQIIIQQIRTSGSVYHLSRADIEYLKANGVGDAIVMEMQATAGRPRPVYVQPVYVEPPPPVSVGVGVWYRFR